MGPNNRVRGHVVHLCMKKAPAFNGTMGNIDEVLFSEFM